jgi:hypothetical protein
MLTMTQLKSTIRNLCTPAFVYFSVSSAFMVLSILQNLFSGNNFKYVFGNDECPVTNCALVFVAKLVYIAFWTWMLNLMCNDGQSTIAWIVLLLPLVVMFLLIGAGMTWSKRNANNHAKKNDNDNDTNREQFMG